MIHTVVKQDAVPGNWRVLFYNSTSRQYDNLGQRLFDRPFFGFFGRILSGHSVHTLVWLEDTSYSYNWDQHLDQNRRRWTAFPDPMARIKHRAPIAPSWDDLEVHPSLGSTYAAKLMLCTDVCGLCWFEGLCMDTGISNATTTVCRAFGRPGWGEWCFLIKTRDC